MNKLYEITDALLQWQTIGSLIGLCVSVVLVQLIRASWSIASVLRPGILLSVALLVWNLGGLANALLITVGFDYLSVPAKVACAIGYTGLTVLTWAVLTVWELSIEGHWRRRVLRFLQMLSICVGALLTVWLWMDAIHSNAPLSRTAIRVAAEASLYILVLTGMALALSSRPARTTWLCAGLTVFGFAGPLASALLIPFYDSFPQAWRVGLAVYSEQSINYVAVAAFVLLARLRYTDVLVERVLQFLSIVLVGSLLWLPLHSFLLGLPGDAHRQAALFIAVVVSIAAMALSVSTLNCGIRKLTERIFKQPDFDAELRRFSDSFPQIGDAVGLLHRAEQVLADLFGFSMVQIVVADSVPQNLLRGLATYEILEQQPGSHAYPLREFAADALVPIYRGHQDIAYVIAIAHTAEQRGFLASELSFLFQFASRLSEQLETIRAEREKNERQQREARLIHQSTEAELRALRAQINPHFLFNALNTIADLIVVDAARAERMTERLADVFRHLLTHSQKSTISVREEIEFVQHYLEIEEARFRDRLRVRIQMDGATEEIKIPALILQPLVENAIKHGLAPKIEGGVLSVSAHRTEHDLLLIVEDDGVGFCSMDLERPFALVANGNGKATSTGVGLANVNQRLQTLYGAQAAMLVERPSQSGCRVTIRIPI